MSKKKSRPRKPSIFRPFAAVLLLIVAGLTAAWYFEWEPLRPAFLSVEVLLARLSTDVAQEVQRRKPAAKPPNKTPAAKPKDAAQPAAAQQKTAPSGPAAAGPQVPPPSVAPPAESKPGPAPAPAPQPESPPPTPTPAPAAAPKPPEPPPWQAALDATDALPAALDVCFGDFDPSQFLPQADDVKKWFEPVAGAALDGHQHAHQVRRGRDG